MQFTSAAKAPERNAKLAKKRKGKAAKAAELERVRGVELARTFSALKKMRNDELSDQLKVWKLVEKKGDVSKTTGNRIAAVMSTFKDFDTDMKVGTRQRREKDEFKLHQMREQLALLEKNLGAETKYRAEMHKSVSAWGHEEIDRLKEHCEKAREEQKARLDRRFVAIKARIEEMEIRFAKDMAAIPLDIEQKGAHLAEVLRETVGAVDAEKRDRVERETKIANTLADHEALVGQTFEEHRDARMHAVDEIQVGCVFKHNKIK